MAKNGKKHLASNLHAAVMQHRVPAVTLWNRLEGRPRREDFERSLRAEVHDALWMLTRQWQMGEFIGDDAASPITAKAQVSTRDITSYQPGKATPEPFDDSTPLEARVEQLPIPFSAGGHPRAQDIRLLAGRHWLKTLKKVVPSAVDAFIAAYPIDGFDPSMTAAAETVAHPLALAHTSLVAGRRMDGVKLYDFLKSDPGHGASDGIAEVVGTLQAEVDDLGQRFVTWFERLFYQPTQEPAWLPERLEYQFSASAPRGAGEQVFSAEEYFHGHLDWYNFEQSQVNRPNLISKSPKRMVRTMLPSPVAFDGMPHTRWWRFESGRTNFGDVQPDTTDLGKLLLVEFALLYANDWYLMPFTVDAGTVSNVDGIAVTNVFGERTWIEPAGKGVDADWERWAMYVVSQASENAKADLTLMIPPSAQKVQDSPPCEEIMFIRDEMANMVWGIERTIPLPTGHPRPGGEAAREMRAYFERVLEAQLGAPPEPPPMAENAKIRYRVMTDVPEHWIPMIPVHREGQRRQVQLQRASMPRILPGDPEPPVPVRPRTSLLRTGLDSSQPYFLHEEEVPRAGVRVRSTFQRTRWRDGRVWVWLGVRKQTGRGEGSSGLAFDGLQERRRLKVTKFG